MRAPPGPGDRNARVGCRSQRSATTGPPGSASTIGRVEADNTPHARMEKPVARLQRLAGWPQLRNATTRNEHTPTRAVAMDSRLSFGVCQAMTNPETSKAINAIANSAA